MNEIPLRESQAQALARSVVVACEQVGDAMPSAGDYDELGDVPPEAWEAVADRALQLWTAATAAAGVAGSGETDA